MDLEKGAYPPKGDAPGLAATSPHDIENPSAPPEAGALGETAVKAGLERASIRENPRKNSRVPRGWNRASVSEHPRVRGANRRRPCLSLQASAYLSAYW